MNAPAFDRYVVMRHLARGGMAELYLAKATPNRFAPQIDLCVVKHLAPQLANDPSFRNMFADEAQVSRLLCHPNIVRTIDAGIATDGAPYYVMEYLHGVDLVTLRGRLRRLGQHLGMASALSIALQVCRALAYAHRAVTRDGTALNLVHRDVSPANVFATTTGVVKLIDFGIARSNTQAERTQAGVLKGKLRYMSPEQARSGWVDRRSDVFSTGVLLWELLVGRRLFNQDGDLAILRAVVDGHAPAPSSLRPDCPRELDDIVRIALQPNPAHRFQTADDMAQALEQFAARARLDLSNAALCLALQPLFAEGVTALGAPQDAAEPSFPEITFEATETVASRWPTLQSARAALYVAVALGVSVAVAASL